MWLGVTRRVTIADLSRCRSLLYSANNFFNAAFSGSRVHNALNHTVRHKTNCKIITRRANRPGVYLTCTFSFFFCSAESVTRVYPLPCIFFPWLCQHSGRRTQQLTFVRSGTRISLPRGENRKTSLRANLCGWRVYVWNATPVICPRTYRDISNNNKQTKSPSQWVSMY